MQIVLAVGPTQHSIRWVPEVLSGW